MRGTTFLAGTILATLLAPFARADQQQTFVEACLGKTQILTKTFDCGVTAADNKSAITFTLKKGLHIEVKAGGIFGDFSKSLKVYKIRHLPVRRDLTLGEMDESVEFYAREITGSFMATVTIPCNQAQYAAVGAERVSKDDEPSQTFASCQVK